MPVKSMRHDGNECAMGYVIDRPTGGTLYFTSQYWKRRTPTSRASQETRNPLGPHRGRRRALVVASSTRNGPGVEHSDLNKKKWSISNICATMIRTGL